MRPAHAQLSISMPLQRSCRQTSRAGLEFRPKGCCEGLLRRELAQRREAASGKWPEPTGKKAYDECLRPTLTMAASQTLRHPSKLRSHLACLWPQKSLCHSEKHAMPLWNGPAGLAIAQSAHDKLHEPSAAPQASPQKRTIMASCDGSGSDSRTRQPVSAIC